MCDLNRAILAKWAWNLVQGHDSLCCKVLKARYLLHNTFLSSSSGALAVKDLILQPGIWNSAKLNDLFDPHIVEAITAMRIPMVEKQDRIIWAHASNGIFSVKSAYLIDNASCFSGITGILKAYWNKICNCSSILTRHKLLWWNILTNSLPTRNRIHSCFNIDNLTCPICNSNSKNILRLFMFCDLARRMWFASPWNLRLDLEELVSPMHYLRFLWDIQDRDAWRLSGHLDRNILLFASVLNDHIWKYRNHITHEGSTQNPMTIYNSVYIS
ncbi:hypothetical protein UlMin_004407 [Ulmus minor]